MKYLKIINVDIFGVIIIVFIFYTICGGILLDAIPTDVELDVHRFNLKTISVIGLLITGFSLIGLIKMQDYLDY